MKYGRHVYGVAYSFSVYELALHDGNVRKALETILETSTQLFSEAGFDPSLLVDFTEIAMDTLQSTHSESALLEAFNDSSTSNCIVAFFRFLVSGYLKTHTDEYAMFVEGMDLRGYCEGVVEVFGKESDELEVMAMVKVMGIAVNVIYLDGRGDDTQIIHHLFQNNNSNSKQTELKVNLLYRPGHYDVLYN